MSDVVIIFVALYRYENFPVRILHPLLQKIQGIKPYSIFLKNCDTNQFEYPSRKEEELFLGLIKKLDPDIVSFTVLSPFSSIAQKLTRLIKQINPNITIIWGGVHPTIFPDDSIKDADIICIGEGEGALTELVTYMRDGQDYHNIKNLWVRNSDQITKNPLRPLIQNLNSLPYPLYGDNSYYFINKNKVILNDPLLSESTYTIQTSRGCPWKCSFCVNSLLKPKFKDLGPYVRRKSVDNVISEISQHLSLTNGMTKSIFFVDEVFAIEKEWLENFVIKYKKEIGLPFFVEYHPKLLSLEVLDKLVEAGLDEVDIGIQSGSDTVRNNIYNRPGTNTEIVKLANEVTHRGIKIKYDLILNSPYDNEKELEDTIQLLFRLPKPLNFNLFSMQFFPNYPLTTRAIDEGYIKKEDAGMDTLLEKTMNHWAYTPKLFPFTRNQILKNIIWLIVWNHANEKTANQAVFSNQIFSGFSLHYLNIKSILFGKIFGVGRPQNISYLISAITYIKTGEFKLLFLKIKEKYL